MIAGLNRFREFFKDFSEQYVLIGGVAALEWLDAAGLAPRSTKDLDIVLIVESLDGRFLARLWEFIKAGRYDNHQKSTSQRIYYRFTAPPAKDYPFVLEIFSRQPEGLVIWAIPKSCPSLPVRTPRACRRS